jgi:hypothetical protein
VDDKSSEGYLMSVSDSEQDEGLVLVIGTGALGLSVVTMVVGAVISIYGSISGSCGASSEYRSVFCRGGKR